MVATSVLLVSGLAATEDQYYGGVPGSRNVILLEHNLVANGTVVTGSAQFRSVDFPTYWFNADTRELNGKLDFPVNDSLLIIYGDALTLKGNFGAGTGNKLFGIYGFPVQADKAYIFSADRAGSVGLNINNQTMYLRPGQQYTYQEHETLVDGNATIVVDYDHSYVNRGLIAKNAITPRYVP